MYFSILVEQKLVVGVSGANIINYSHSNKLIYIFVTKKTYYIQGINKGCLPIVRYTTIVASDNSLMTKISNTVQQTLRNLTQAPERK